jgi:Cu/Ag efflux pump CusA
VTLSPLSPTVIGGMLAATLLAIFVIPFTYYVVERFAANRRQSAAKCPLARVQRRY